MAPPPRNQTALLLFAVAAVAALLVLFRLPHPERSSAPEGGDGPRPPSPRLGSPHGPGLGAQILTAIRTPQAASTFAAPVVVRAASFSDGSVEVGISHPLVDAAPSENLPKMKALASVTFPPGGAPPRIRAYHSLPAAPEAAANARAAASACAYLRRQGWLPDLMQITVRSRRDGYVVLVQDVPYTAGGFCTVELTHDLRFTRFSSGE